MHSHHSHSGSYSQHGSSPLDSMVERAESLQMKLFCLTEHIPRRSVKYLYPEEKNTFNDEVNLQKLNQDFEDFVIHAQTIKNEAAAKGSSTKYIIGTEIESCDDDQIMFAKEIMEKYRGVVKFCVGSVHHVNEIPIDFDQENWNLALEKCQNNLKQLLLDYFNLQYKMLQVMKPLIVGHFDLYKLFLPEDMKVDSVTGQVVTNESSNSLTINVRDVSLIDLWDDVQQLVIRNLKFINSYNGLLEINTSALRKGLKEPYPGNDICQLAKEYCQGRFVLSDDSHSVQQVAVCYTEVLPYITDIIKLNNIYYLNETKENELEVLSLPIAEFKSDPFWRQSGLP